MVHRKTFAATQEHSLPLSFQGVVKWDIIGLLMETEYADIVPPSFFSEQGFWYVEGHFPCGTEGDTADGRRIVY
jgi:hypothetical protein